MKATFPHCKLSYIPHRIHRSPIGMAIGLSTIVALLWGSGPAFAEEVGCVTTAWKLLGANHKVCVEAFDDPT